MAFSDIGSKDYNDINEDIFGNRIIILEGKVIETAKNDKKRTCKINYTLAKYIYTF